VLLVLLMLALLVLLLLMLLLVLLELFPTLLLDEIGDSIRAQRASNSAVVMSVRIWMRNSWSSRRGVKR